MIVYHTKNINKRFNQRLFENILLNLGIDVFSFLDKWTINIYSLEQTDTRFFDHIKTTTGQKINPSMASGVTGKYDMKLYLHDSNNCFKERENSDRIQHEICHAVLFNTPNFVSGVHNTKSRFIIKFWYWAKFWKRTQVSIIDIRRFIK